MSDSPAVELDVLNAFLENAVAALPHALHVGKAVVEMDADIIYRIRERLQESLRVGENLTDSRLITHYAMITACSLQVAK